MNSILRFISVIKSDRSLASKRGEPKRRRDAKGRYTTTGGGLSASILPSWVKEDRFISSFPPTTNVVRSWMLSDGKFYSLGEDTHHSALEKFASPNRNVYTLIRDFILYGAVAVFPYGISSTRAGRSFYDTRPAFNLSIIAAQGKLTDSQIKSLEYAVAEAFRTNLTIDTGKLDSKGNPVYVYSSSDDPNFERILKTLKRH